MKNICNVYDVYNIYRIPKNEEIKKKWLNIIGHTVGNFSRVCSDHFAEKDFNTNNVMSNVRRLKSNAIPSSMQHERLYLVIKIANRLKLY